jgi:hypothetical protein
VQERVAAGVSYRDMLAEFGILGALVVGFLLVLQLMDFFSNSGGRHASRHAEGDLHPAVAHHCRCVRRVHASFGRPFMFS